ncbi:MAG TPA: DUF6600 domain-containing protein [Thermoanaerobaculia bacterium]|nr:DUF6600 domain-containing protein [Thermoanaerobaculia bacterium]
MRTRSIATTLLMAAGLLAAVAARAQEPPPYQGNDDQPPPPEAAGADPAVASDDYFYGQLAPYGRWVGRDDLGEVWVPQVAHGWRPYTTGHWIYTDQGWAWVADEPWGWAAFHYGRWLYAPDLGWAWVPGHVWAPAWVAWRHGGGYLGWAPLGPNIGFRAEVGLDIAAAAITAGFFTFVVEREILAPRVSLVILPGVRNVTIVRETTNITNYTVVNNRIVDRGVDVHRIEQVTGRPVAQVRVATLVTGGRGRPGAFYQPAVVTNAARVTHAEFGKALPAQVAAWKTHAAQHPASTGANTADRRTLAKTYNSSHSNTANTSVAGHTGSSSTSTHAHTATSTTGPSHTHPTTSSSTTHTTSTPSTHTSSRPSSTHTTSSSSSAHGTTSSTHAPSGQTHTTTSGSSSGQSHPQSHSSAKPAKPPEKPPKPPA